MESHTVFTMKDLSLLDIKNILNRFTGFQSRRNRETGHVLGGALFLGPLDHFCLVVLSECYKYKRVLE